MRTSLVFFRKYPAASLITVFAFLFSGVAEGIGLLSFVPLLYLSLNNGVEQVQGAGMGVLEDLELNTRIINLFGSIPSLQTVILTIFVGLSVKNYLVLLANNQIGMTLAKISFDFRIDILRSIYRSRWEYFVDQPTGYFAGRLTDEVKRAASTYMDSALLIAFIAQGMTYLALAALVSLPLTAIALGVTAIIFFISKRYVAASGSYGRANNHYLKQIAKRAVESIGGLKAIKAMGKEPLLENAFFSEIDKLRVSQMGQITAAGSLNLWQNEIILFFMLLGLFVSFHTDWVSPVEVLLLAAVLMRFFSQTTKVSSQIQKIVIGEAAYNSLTDFLNHAKSNAEIVHGGGTPSLEKSIVFADVGFQYRDKQVLEHCNITILANEITTLVGPSGAGKTTMLDLVAGLLEPQNGKLLIDGVPLGDLDIGKWRKMIGYVPQDAFLLNDTIRNNITLGDETISEAQVEAALVEANAMSFIREFEEGVDLNVGERGSRLSGGQRQRIMIARALVNKPLLLIFDEATSSLDPASEHEICKTISTLRGAHTILCASHKPMLVGMADQVINLK